jgi:hypothetical protein
MKKKEKNKINLYKKKKKIMSPFIIAYFWAYANKYQGSKLTWPNVSLETIDS